MSFPVTCTAGPTPAPGRSGCARAGGVAALGLPSPEVARRPSRAGRCQGAAPLGSAGGSHGRASGPNGASSTPDVE